VAFAAAADALFDKTIDERTWKNDGGCKLEWEAKLSPRCFSVFQSAHKNLIDPRKNMGVNIEISKSMRQGQRKWRWRQPGTLADRGPPPRQASLTQ
jgi:hypothetical protein